MPNEIELKLRIAKADVPRLRRHPAIKQRLAGKPVTRKLVSIYYDTPDFRLLDAAISLRVRRMSGGWFQAIKAAGDSLAGLHQRKEWEDILTKGEPDFSKITEPHLAKIFSDQTLRDALKPIFVTDVSRTEWQLQYEDGSAVEVALDLGELKVGEERSPILEVELELKQGKALHLYELALALQADIPLHIENISKAQRGYAYFLPPPPPIISQARTVALHAKIPTHAASLLIARECLRHLQSNQDMVLHGADPEGVHQMHIAIRRLRTALKIFKLKELYLNNELGWISTALGNVRDWDVFLSETLPVAFHELSPSESHFALQERATSAQTRAHSELRQSLESQRYQRLLLTLGAWLETENDASKKPQDDENIGKLAKRHLQKSYAKLKEYGKTLRELDLEQLHKARIQAKHLRYAMEFLVQALAEKNSSANSHAFIGKLALLQKALGIRNDIAMTEKLVTQLEHGSTNDNLREAVRLIMQWNKTRTPKADKQIYRVWRDLKHLTPCRD
jgi:inorganic triphosphatase YgiF